MKRITCDNCGAFLNIELMGSIVARVRCPKSDCKTWHNIKVVSADPESDRRFKFEEQSNG